MITQEKFLLEAADALAGASETELMGYYRLIKDICDKTVKIIEGLETKSILMILQKALQTLDSRRYNILRLRYWENKTFKNIGNIFSTSPQYINYENQITLQRLSIFFRKIEWRVGDIPIEVLNLNIRGYKTLKNTGINTVEELMTLTKKDMMCIEGIGPNTLEDIEDKLASYMSQVEFETQGRLDKVTIDTLKFSMRVSNALKRNEIFVIQQLIEMSPEEMQNIRGIGDKGVTEILMKRQEAIAKYEKNIRNQHHM